MVEHREHSKSQNVQIAVMWAVVSIPLGYGLFNTIRNTLPLFGG